MIPLGCSGSCQDKEMLFLDVRSFLIVMTGDGAVKRGWEGMMGWGKLIGLGRAERQGNKQMESIVILIFGKKALFPFQRLLSINLASYQASEAGLWPWYIQAYGRWAEIFSCWWTSGKWAYVFNLLL